MDILDDTRIHPEDYDLARKMAADALDIEEVDFEEGDSPPGHVEELMLGELDRLDLLALDEFAKELLTSFGDPKRKALDLIKEELKNPYQGHRFPFSPATNEEIYTMLTGEKESYLKPGMVLTVNPVRILPGGVKCKLNSGLDGWIPLKFAVEPEIYSTAQSEAHNMGEDVKPSVDLSLYYNLHEPIQVKVLSIQEERMSVDLARVVDGRLIERTNGTKVEPMSEHWDFETEQKELMDAESKSVGK